MKRAITLAFLCFLIECVTSKTVRIPSRVNLKVSANKPYSDSSLNQKETLEKLQRNQQQHKPNQFIYPPNSYQSSSSNLNSGLANNLWGSSIPIYIRSVSASVSGPSSKFRHFRSFGNYGQITAQNSDNSNEFPSDRLLRQELGAKLSHHSNPIPNQTKSLLLVQETEESPSKSSYPQTANLSGNDLSELLLADDKRIDTDSGVYREQRYQRIAYGNPVQSKESYTGTGDSNGNSVVMLKSSALGAESGKSQIALPITQSYEDAMNGRSTFGDVYFVAIVAGFSAAAIFGVVSAGYCFYKFQQHNKAAADVDYPAYGVVGPATKDQGAQGSVSPVGDRKLAQSAQMYHYHHQKQQMIASEKAATSRHTSASDVDSDEENEEGDYTVYECPGLASTGEMEVKNPLFQDDITPISSPQVVANKNDK